MQRSNHSVRQAGITLVELLCAMVIAGMVVAVLFAAYFTVIRAAVRQSGDRASAAVSDAFDTLARDFMCALIPADYTGAPFLLTASTGAAPGSRCVFFTATPLAPGDDPRAYAAHAVQLDLRDGRYPGEYAIEYIRRPVPPPVATEMVREVWAPVRAMAFQVYDGQVWTSRWDGADLPRAVRLELSYGADPPQTMALEIPVPAGIPFGPTQSVAQSL